MTPHKKMTDRQKYQAALWRQGAPQREAERERLLATGTPNPKRITMALDSRGLEGPEVDEACGGSEPMVDEWEAGMRTPTPEQMRLLSEMTGYSVEFFYREVRGPVWMWRWVSGIGRTALIVGRTAA